jgi:hypothetical protein
LVVPPPPGIDDSCMVTCYPGFKPSGQRCVPYNPCGEFLCPDGMHCYQDAAELDVCRAKCKYGFRQVGPECIKEGN